MGQNGSGKSTIIKLINGSLQCSSGMINLNPNLVVSTAFQVMPTQYRCEYNYFFASIYFFTYNCRSTNPIFMTTFSNLTLREFFSKQLQNNTSGLESRISSALLTVQLQSSAANIPLERIIGSFSGGQQARLLLAAALILDPDILLLGLLIFTLYSSVPNMILHDIDEPTNNLDKAGIDFLTQYIQETTKTCVVISHDEDFLNSFSDSVLYLDLHAKKVINVN